MKAPNYVPDLESVNFTYGYKDAPPKEPFALTEANGSLTEANYHSPEANQAYMSASQFKRFQQCEAMALAELNGLYQPEPSTALLVGSYVDAALTGDLELFKAQHPEILTQKGTLRADYEHANYIVERVRRDEAFMAALAGQHQVIMTGQIEGVPVKVKIDSLLPHMTVDLKCMRDLDGAFIRDEGLVRPWWSAWGYQYQAAIYQSVRAQNEGGEVKPFGIAVVTKEKPEPDIGLFEFPQSILDAAMDEIRDSIVYFDMIKQGMAEPTRCEACAFCRQTKILKGWETLA
mgnify:CR=1 FL=1